MDIPSEVYDIMEFMIKTVVKKEKSRLYQKEYHKNYYAKNKVNTKKYYEEHKAERQQYQLDYYHKHKEENRKEYDREYYREYHKKYFKSDHGKKIQKINSWKRRGLICDDYEYLYEKVINTTNCEQCGVLLTEYIDKMTCTTKSMDHDHTTGLFRNVLCHSCNRKRN